MIHSEKNKMLLFHTIEDLFGVFFFHILSGKGPLETYLSTEEKIKEQICVLKHNEVCYIKGNKALHGDYFFVKH